MLEYKKRTKPDTCDVAKCRQRSRITRPAPDVPNKFCPTHLVEWHAEHNQSTGDAAPPDAQTTVVPAAPPERDDTTDSPDFARSQASILAIVEPIRTEADGMVASLQGLAITTQSVFDKAGALLVDTKSKLKALESERTSVTKPLLDAKKAIDAWFKPAKQSLTVVESLLKSSMAAFVTAQERAKLEALQLGNHDAALAVEPAVMPAGISTRTTWKYEIVDVDAVPREYLVIDSAAVQAHVTAHKSQSSIPGIRAYPDTGIAAGSK